MRGVSKAAGQSLKVWNSILHSPLKTTSRSRMQPSKAWSSIFVTLAGMMTLVSAVQFLKALYAILDTPFSMVTLFKDVQLRKQL